MEKKVKKIGMIVAVEIAAVMKRYEGRLEDASVPGFEVKLLRNEDYELYIVNSGAGEIASSSAVQLLISHFGVSMVVNFGVVGGLTPEMSVAKLAVVTDVVQVSSDPAVFTSVGYPTCNIPATDALVKAALAIEPDLKPVICASGDKFIGSSERKWALHEEYNADICEMEAAGIVLTCNRNNVPCLLIKAVSDSMGGGAEEFAKEFERCADICLETVDKLIRML